MNWKILLITIIIASTTNSSIHSMLPSWDYPPIIQQVTPAIIESREQLGFNLFSNNSINTANRRSRNPHSYELQYTCHQFITKNIFDSAQVFSSDENQISNVKKILNQKQNPTVGDIVLYTGCLLENDDVDLSCRNSTKNIVLLHSGIVIKVGNNVENTVVRSKFGEYSVIDHLLFDILEGYGNTASFFTPKKQCTDIISKQVLAGILYKDALNSSNNNRETHNYIEDPLTAQNTSSLNIQEEYKYYENLRDNKYL